MRLIRSILAALAGFALAGAPAAAAPWQPLLSVTYAGAPAAGAPPAAYSYDFTTGVYSTSFATTFTFTRASLKTNLYPGSAAGAAYATFQANEPAFTAGQGITVEEARTNYYLNSAMPVASQTITLPTGNYTLWVNGAGSATVSAGTAAISGGQNNYTGAFVTDFTARHGASLYFVVTTAGTVTVTTSGSLNAVQLENGIGGTSFILTGGASATRASETFQVLNTVPFWTTVSATSASGTVLISAVGTEATPYLGTFLKMGSAVAARETTMATGFGADSGGANGEYLTWGQGALRDGIRYAISYTTSGRRMTANGGPISTGSKLIPATVSATNVRLGHVNTTTQVCNCFIRSFELWTSPLSDFMLRRKASVGLATNAYVIGDSLASRAGITQIGGDGIFTKIGALSGGRFLFNNGGRSGDLTSQGLSRFNTYGHFDTPVVIWLGSNVTTPTSNMVADIASIVSRIKTSKYLIVGALNADNATGRLGGTNYLAIVDLNSQLAATYGSRFLDLRAAMVAAYDPTDAREVANHDADVSPNSMRYPVNIAWLAAPIDASATSFSTTLSNMTGVVKLGTEYINITASSGTSVTAATRGYNSSTAAPHGVTEPIVKADPLHLSDKGGTFVAQAIYAKMLALGW